MIWLLTCEHYSNQIPMKYSEVFINAVDVLESHRGYDLRIAPMFLRLEPLFDQGFYNPYSRLLIEPNRSLSDSHLFSAFTMVLSRETKASLIAEFYQPYRKSIEDFIESYLDQTVLHLSLHSFHPTLGNQNRETPIGIRFDSNRIGDRELAVLWRKEIEQQTAHKIRFNYPYRGAEDDFQNYLRKRFPNNYVGLSLDIRNDCVLELRPAIAASIANLRGVLD